MITEPDSGSTGKIREFWELHHPYPRFHRVSLLFGVKEFEPSRLVCSPLWPRHPPRHPASVARPAVGRGADDGAAALRNRLWVDSSDLDSGRIAGGKMSGAKGGEAKKSPVKSGHDNTTLKVEAYKFLAVGSTNSRVQLLCLVATRPC